LPGHPEEIWLLPVWLWQTLLALPSLLYLPPVVSIVEITQVAVVCCFKPALQNLVCFFTGDRSSQLFL
jgi:hypothetical protein